MVLALVGVATLGDLGSRAVVRFGAVTKVTFEPGLEFAPAISPDGQEIAYVARGSSSSGGAVGAAESSTFAPVVMVRPIGEGVPYRLTGEAESAEEFPAWSRDGTTISFHSRGTLFRLSARGGTPRPVTPVSARYGAWSPDGSELAFVRLEGEQAGIFVRSSAGEERKLADVDAGTTFLQWSPNGRWIAFTEGNSAWLAWGPSFGNMAPSRVGLVSTTGEDPVWITSSENRNTSPAWLPDGRLLFVSSRGGTSDVYLAELDGNGTPAEEPVRVTAGLNPHSISLSLDGGRLAYSTLVRTQNVRALRIPTRGPVSAYESSSVTEGQQVIEGLAVSRDGEWLAFDSNRSGSQDVYVRRLVGGEVLRLTTAASDEFARSWSPDGRWIAGHAYREGNRDIFIVDRDGLEVEWPAPHASSDVYPSFSPDGTRLAFTSGRSGRTATFVVARDSAGGWSEPRQLNEDASQTPRWLPDGSAVLYHTGTSVWIVPMVGEPRRILVDPDAALGVRIEAVELYDQGRRVLFLRRFPDGTSGIWSIPTGGGAPTELIRFDDPSRQPRLELAVHDETIYFTIGEFESDIWVMDVEW
jgi:Tol biopolymer transport system component